MLSDSPGRPVQRSAFDTSGKPLIRPCSPRTPQTTQGGQKTTLQNIYRMVMHFRGLVVPPGYTAPLKFADGNPYGVSHVTGANNQNELEQHTIDALEHMTQRVLTIAERLV